MAGNQRQMEKASLCLSPVNSYTDGLPIFFLTGKKYFYQTLFCIQSLSKHSTERYKFILVDDGSFDEGLTRQIMKQLPGAQFISQASIDQNIEERLPIGIYPVLRRKRKEYPHIKKLTDIHTLPGDDWKLVLDSDMLFYNNPIALINWLKRPDRPLHMVDCTESYGYTTGLMEKLSGVKIPPLLNVGAIGLDSTSLSWTRLEKWTKILEEKEGKTYYLEQALSAMLIGEGPALILNPDHYIVNPGKPASLNYADVLHHYVDLSKKEYYNNAWKKFI